MTKRLGQVATGVNSLGASRSFSLLPHLTFYLEYFTTEAYLSRAPKLVFSEHSQELSPTFKIHFLQTRLTFVMRKVVYRFEMVWMLTVMTFENPAKWTVPNAFSFLAFNSSAHKASVNYSRSNLFCSLWWVGHSSFSVTIRFSNNTEKWIATWAN